VSPRDGLRESPSRVMQAHAKVNLLLRVLAREASGYHAIETLFQRLALHDVVRVAAVAEAGSRTLECAGPAMPAGGIGAMHQNLAWKAAEAYVTASGWSTGWHIAIEKHIPVGGGLGGGSSDAAAVLRAFESMSPSPIGAERLLALAGALGADVAFLVSDASLALAWGRGNRMLLLPPLPVVPVTLYTFADGVNTAAAYAAIAAARDADSRRGAPIASARASARAYAADSFASWDSVCALAINDFDEIAMQLHPGVGELLPQLRTWAAVRREQGEPVIAMVSGSGATCFFIGDASAIAPSSRAHMDSIYTQTMA